jgi:hypothetical protein
VCGEYPRGYMREERTRHNTREKGREVPGATVAFGRTAGQGMCFIREAT